MAVAVVEGWEEAVAVVVAGAGAFAPLTVMLGALPAPAPGAEVVVVVGTLPPAVGGGPRDPRFDVEGAGTGRSSEAS